MARVLQVVRDRLLTPVGLRSLAPGHPDYKAKDYGDLRSRDAAYHQGTVWGWLIGLRRRVAEGPPGGSRGAAAAARIPSSSDEACVGSISEIFDAEAPYTPRGVSRRRGASPRCCGVSKRPPPRATRGCHVGSSPRWEIISALGIRPDRARLEFTFRGTVRRASDGRLIPRARQPRAHAHLSRSRRRW